MKRISSLILRAQGCLLGQLAGDALGSLVEFQTPKNIKKNYPDGVRKLVDGGTWSTVAGQPTDDSEMALLLARMLIEQGTYNQEEARKAYVFWLNSEPFDCGNTISGSLQGYVNQNSQANGAMMRVSPIGIFGVNHELQKVAEWAKLDAAITHIHPICQQANALFTMAIASAVKTGIGAQELYNQIVTWAKNMEIENTLMQTITSAAEKPHSDYVHKMGWVLIAFQNALWQLLHATTLEEGVIDTVMRGGDTDTNAAICGALLGAVQGKDAIPEQWINCILNCRPKDGQPGVLCPRPECFWPVDALEIAKKLTLE